MQLNAEQIEDIAEKYFTGSGQMAGWTQCVAAITEALELQAKANSGSEVVAKTYCVAHALSVCEVCGLLPASPVAGEVKG